MQNEIMNRIKAIEKTRDSQANKEQSVQVTPTDIRIRKKERTCQSAPTKTLVTEDEGKLSEGEVSTPMTQSNKEENIAQPRRSLRLEQNKNRTEPIRKVSSPVQVFEPEMEETAEEDRLNLDFKNAENAHRIQELAKKAREHIDWEDSNDDSTTEYQKVNAMISGTSLKKKTNNSTPLSLQKVINQRHLPDCLE